MLSNSKSECCIVRFFIEYSQFKSIFVALMRVVLPFLFLSCLLLSFGKASAKKASSHEDVISKVAYNQHQELWIANIISPICLFDVFEFDLEEDIHEGEDSNEQLSESSNKQKQHPQTVGYYHAISLPLFNNIARFVGFLYCSH